VTGRSHAADVYRYALALSGSSVDAEDVTHTALAEEYWIAQGRPAPRSRRKRLIDIAHDVCRRRLDRGADGEEAPGGCPEAELALTRRADRRLPLGERRALRSHLRACTECAALADELLAQRQALRALAEAPVPAPFGQSENSTASLPGGRHLHQ
jgi:DNA-directed RNA polymerase specialized sigma24 family protein